MMATVSIGTMVERIAGLLGTKDISAWEDGFISSVRAKSNNGRDTTRLTEKQVETVERIFTKHYGDAG